MVKALWFLVAVTFGFLGADVYRIQKPKVYQYKGEVRQVNHTRNDVLYGKLLFGEGTCPFDRKGNYSRLGPVKRPCLIYVGEEEDTVYFAVRESDEDMAVNHKILEVWRVTIKGTIVTGVRVWRDGEVNI